MKELNITIPEGYEIDLENSDLASGKIVFKLIGPKAWRHQNHKMNGYFISTMSEIKVAENIDSELECNHNVFATEKDEAESAIEQLERINNYLFEELDLDDAPEEQK